MNKNKRFIRSVIETAKTTDVELPWQRGTRRAAFIAKRGDKTRMMRKSA